MEQQAVEESGQIVRTKKVAAVWATMKAQTGHIPGRSRQNIQENPWVRVTNTVDRPEVDTCGWLVG
jgi:hypothetical protein